MSACSSSYYTVKFVPFSSTVEAPFWVHYCHLKLETLQLDTKPLDMVGFLAHKTNRLQVSETAFSCQHKNEYLQAQGQLKGFNTLEDFMTCDKNAFIKLAFEQEFSKANVEALTSFQLITFADLKQHKVVYWFAFPALLTSTPIQATLIQMPSTTLEWYPSLPRLYHALRKKQQQLDEKSSSLPPFFVFSSVKNGNNDDDYNIQPLSSTVLTTMNVPLETIVFGFLDTTTTTSSDSDTTATEPPMGWTLRNLLAYLSIHLQLGGQSIQVVSFRPTQPFRRLTTTSEDDDDLVSQDHASHVLQMTVPMPETYGHNNINNNNYKVVGWELNARNKAGPRSVNLRPLLDSTHLAIQAADLNLKLMKWRMIPQLNVEKLQNLKVLLLGAGTLGCSVARTLLGWGIRHFTILDYGNVSYSNPVRQNLFTLQDCHEQNGNGKPKAQAAVDALKEIAADVHATAVALSIPMPGHPNQTLATLQETTQQLDQLIQDCDVVFLLTDTRESRWLPTVMAAAHDKPLINAALGLDSWLVMRHGGGIIGKDGSDNDDDDVPPRLGCYFCNDVVAPENSTKNRTLDQQCTVTRPGLAPIASSMAVELVVSMLHHPLQQRAPAPKATTTNNSNNNNGSNFSPTIHDDNQSMSSALGVMPHQIRGSLVTYTMMTPTVPAFHCCTACSQPVVSAYQKDKHSLMEHVIQNAQSSTTYLEELSGLTAFRAKAEAQLADLLQDGDNGVNDEDDW